MAYTTIDDPTLYFQIKLYTGNNTAIGSGGLAVTFDGDTDMQPDFVWIKARTDAESSKLYDSVRGVTKELESDQNALEATNTEGLTTFGSDGFTIGNLSSINASSNNYIAWCWKESATSGFDIVTATGTGSAKTISHSLSAVPHLIYSKEKSGSVNDWVIYHHRNTSAPETDNLILNEPNATSDYPYWNDTTPTSSVFSVGTGSVVNRSSSTYVYYLWSEKQGFSKFGGWTGNGNADGPYIHTGFKIAWLMYKPSSASDNWEIHSNKTDPFNPMDTLLYANIKNAESSPGGTTDRLDFTANGFKIRTGSSDYNGSGTSYVYMAFAEAPFVNSNGVPCNAR
jgi:hypothetical protein